MRRGFVLVGVIVLMVAVVPAAEAGKKGKKKKSDFPEATPQEYQLLLRMEPVTGTLATFDDNPKVVTVDIDLSPAEAGGGGGKSNSQNLAKMEQEVEQAEVKVAQSRTAQDRVKNLQHLAEHMQRLQSARAEAAQPKGSGKSGKGKGGNKAYTKQFELPAVDSVKVRLAELPDRYDDKGKLQPYTAQEKQERKGSNPKLPGYEAAYADLQVGQTVKVYLVKKLAPKKEAVKKDTDVDQAKADKATDDNKPQVTMIMVEKQPSFDSPGQDTKKK